MLLRKTVLTTLLLSAFVGAPILTSGSVFASDAPAVQAKLARVNTM